MNPAEEFLRARDFLLAHRTDYEAAWRGFPLAQAGRIQLGAGLLRCDGRRHGRTALWIVDENGHEIQLSFTEVSERSNEEATEALHAGRESCHPEAASVGTGSDLRA